MSTCIRVSCSKAAVKAMIHRIKGVSRAIGVQAEEVMNMLSLKQHISVAVTGIAGGGKTVFLTSLLSHLAEFGQGSFHLDKGVDITDFRRVPLRGDWPPAFTLSNYREDLSRGLWPGKTTDCSRYVCEFKRSDWRFSTQKISFFDFPGERIADASIAAFPDYGSWSDHILGHFSRHHGYLKETGPYLEYIDRKTVSDEGLVSMYREALARLILNYKPLISPSTFLLDQKGVPATPGTPAQIAASRYAGISPARQFAPLSDKSRKKHPELTRRMSRVYKEYRNQVVMPVFENISRACSMVILVDIPSLLAGGVGRYNDDRQVLMDLFEVMRPRSDIGARLMKHLAFWQKSLNRVAFVAAKADLVHPMDIENGRMKNLLKMMTDRARRMMSGVRSKWFVCSACHSTFAVEGRHRLKGRIFYDNPAREFREFSVTELPEAWPEKWEAGEYPFYKVFPDAPENYLIPPRHRGLDQIFEFIASFSGR